MNPPKYIVDLIYRRMKYAYQLTAVDYELSEWLRKNNIEVNSEDTFGGVEIYCNPGECAKRIIEAIKEK